MHRGYAPCAYLQSPEQLATVLYPGDVKQLVDGSVCQLRAELRVGLDGVQDLLLVFAPGNLQQDGDDGVGTRLPR